MASVPLVLAAYVLSFVLPVVLPGAGWVLLHCVVTGGLLAFVLFGGEPEPNGPTRALSAAVYVLFWLVMLSGLVARWSCRPVARASRSGAVMTTRSTARLATWSRRRSKPGRDKLAPL